MDEVYAKILAQTKPKRKKHARMIEMGGIKKVHEQGLHLSNI
jgi:hypothetical protein